MTRTNHRRWRPQLIDLAQPAVGLLLVFTDTPRWLLAAWIVLIGAVIVLGDWASHAQREVIDAQAELIDHIRDPTDPGDRR